MSKRPLRPLSIGAGASKLPKLEVTISEHNFPLSQNVQQRSSPRDPALSDVWGDDNDDDLLLQASQACEQQNLSALPEYSCWMQAPSTSTQYQEDKNIDKKKEIWPNNFGASTSASSQNTTKKLEEHNFLNFSFKKPISNSMGKVSNTGLLKDRCNGISSPLSGISGNVKQNAADELFVLDNMGGDSEHFYKKLLQEQEENARLRSENSKLLEQALSKDGEVTILRGRLKSSQAAVDNARLERIQTNEKMQMEWTEKLAALGKQVGSLKTQLDCKDLEVVRMKERCRLLDNNKVKLSQMASSQLNNTSISQRPNLNNNFSIQNDMKGTFAAPRNKLASTGAQTEKQMSFLRLNTAYRTGPSNLSQILARLLEPETEQQSIFRDVGSDYAQSECESLDAFQNVRPARAESSRGKKLSLSLMIEEMSLLSSVTRWATDETVLRKCLNIMTQVKSYLTEVLRELEDISQTVTTAFQRDLDDKYAQELVRYTPVETEQLYGGKAIFKDEHTITARRATAALASLCALCAPLGTRVCDLKDGGFVALMSHITRHIATASCAVQYSGLLMSFIFLIRTVLSKNSSDSEYERLSSIVRDILLARPGLPVVCAALPVLRALSLRESGLIEFCAERSSGNLKFDYDQGLVLYKRDSCFLQVFLCQLETYVKCTERQALASGVLSVAQGLLSLYRNAEALNVPWSQLCSESRCKCSVRLAQVIVYIVQVCARMLKDGVVDQHKDKNTREGLLAACRRGVCILYQWSLKDVEMRTLLDRYEGRFLIFVDLCNEMREDIVVGDMDGNILTELLSTVESSEELEMPSSAVRQVWIDSFDQFHITN